MDSSLIEQHLMQKGINNSYLDQGSAFSFGAQGLSSLDYMKTTKPIELVNIEN